MIKTGKKSESPSNGGQMIGAGIDLITGNRGQMQAILGTVNDLGSMAIDIDSDYKALSTVDHWLNSWDRPGNAYWGLGEDGNSIYESIK